MLRTRVCALGLAASLAGVAPSQAAMWGAPPTLAPLAAPAQFDGGTETFVFEGQEYCWYDDGWNGPGWYVCEYGYTDGYGWGGGEGWNGFFVSRPSRNFGPRWRDERRHGFGELAPDRRWRRDGGFQPHFRGGQNDGGFQPHYRGGDNDGGGQSRPGGGFRHDGGGFRREGGGGGGFRHEGGGGGFHQGGGVQQGLQQGGGAASPRGYNGPSNGGGQRNPREAN